MTRWVAGSLFVLLVASVSADTDKTKRPQTAAPAPSDQKQKGQHEALLSAVEEITRQVAVLRGLPLKSQFQRGVLSREEIGRRLKERIQKEYSEKEVQVESAVLKRMGLLPLDANYEKLLFDLLTEQVAGFYDPYQKTLYIADWLPLEMQRPALAHEIEHALQDQHFDLQKFSQTLKENGDKQLARAAVVEGDGTAVMLEFVAQSMGLDLAKMPEMVSQLGKQMMQLSMGTTPAIKNAPAVLRETLVFPYAAGLDFIESMRMKHPWSRIDEVFQKPPDSTEQVMHPEKYHGGEQPVLVTPAPLLILGERKEIKRDVLGEMSFKIWFGSKMAEDVAERAAAGWGGDRLMAYSMEGDALPVVMDLSVWDNEKDAKEAEKAAQKLVSALSSASQESEKQLAFSAERRGTSLLILCGVPQAQRAKLTDEVFRSWR